LRSILFGFLISILYYKASKKYFLLAFPVFILLFFLKLNSSLGRLLIYKVSLQILKDNWVWGIGLRKFRQQYNLYQANYFKNHDINSFEAYLADNSYYAFNDFLQIFIELGLINTISIISIVTGLLLIIQFNSTLTLKKTKILHALVISILVASCFNHILYRKAIQIALLLIVALYLYFYKIEIKTNQKIFNLKKVLISMYLCILMFFFIKVISVYNINISTQQAQDYSIIGYHKQANSIYNELEKKYFVTEQVKMDLISNLYTLNKLDEARQKINELKKDYTYNELYSISAKLYMEQNDTLNAEKDFLTASYIAPNRMLKRYDLALFYLQTKDTTKALYWANSILIMPIKVPSNTTENTLNKTKTLLNSLTFNKK
jgi:hypothetical protein